jgi:hypothetical protein
VAEVRSSRTARDDEHVVIECSGWHRARGGSRLGASHRPGAATKDHEPFVGADVDRFVLHDAHAASALQDRTNRRGDVARREAAGRDLVEEGLEEVKVAIVDHGDARSRGREHFGGVEPAESTPDDDHARIVVRLRRRRHGVAGWKRR